MAYQIRVRRKDFPSYKRYLSEQEYRLVKKRIAEELKPFSATSRNLLDVGCWDGESTLYFAEQLGIKNLFGLEVFPEMATKAKNRGIQVGICNLESECIPFENEQFDLVIANQVFEHLKDIYHAMTELHRVLRTSGYLLFSVPNLASLHCRAQILCGVQPSIIQLFDAHVRVFTPHALKPFLTFGNHFTIMRLTGSGYYPFPPVISSVLSKIMPKSALFLAYVLRKNASTSLTWAQEIKSKALQSAF